jgi:7-cyano-7-deazaguanine synthase
MAKDLAIVLNSGGVKSAVVTALAAQKYRPILLHAEAAQLPGSRIRAAYDQQVGHFKPYREHTLAMPYLSMLADRTPAGQLTADPRVAAPLAPVLLELLPLLAAAACFAAHYNAATIYIGTRVGDDGDELAQATEFFQIWNEMLQLPCGLGELEIQAPLLELELWQVVDVGFQVNAPFDKTWSCSESAAEPCWACPGCRAREAAFQQSAKPDPLRGVRKV